MVYSYIPCIGSESVFAGMLKTYEAFGENKQIDQWDKAKILQRHSSGLDPAPALIIWHAIVHFKSHYE